MVELTFFLGKLVLCLAIVIAHISLVFLLVSKYEDWLLNATGTGIGLVDCIIAVASIVLTAMVAVALLCLLHSLVGYIM